MKFYSPDKSLLIDVRAIKDHPDGIVIEGKIMGSMPMKAILRPEEMRAAFKLVSRPLVFKILRMLIRGKTPSKDKPPSPDKKR